MTEEQAFEEAVAEACQRMLLDTDAGQKLAEFGAKSRDNRNVLRDVKKCMLGLKESKGYTYLAKAMTTRKPFAVIRIDKLYRIPKESFDAWMKQINLPIQN